MQVLRQAAEPGFWVEKQALLPGLRGWYAATMRAMPSCTFRTSSAAFLAALLLAGCGTLDVPRADNYPATGQKKARAVHHWDVLANDVAARVAEKIAAWPAGEHPIHLTVTDKSSFSQGFLKLLRVQLLNRGVTLATGPPRWNCKSRPSWCNTWSRCLQARPCRCTGRRWVRA